MRIVGVLFRDDGQAAADGLDDAGQVVDVVGQLPGFDGGQDGGLVFGALCSLFDGEFLMVPEFGNCAAGVVVHLPHIVFLLFVHIVFCLRGLITFLTAGPMMSQ